MQHDLNPIVSTKSIDLCILILGSYGPPKPISYRILVFPSLCQTIISSDTVKGTPDLCKKWVLGVHMAPEWKRICRNNGIKCPMAQGLAGGLVCLWVLSSHDQELWNHLMLLKWILKWFGKIWHSQILSIIQPYGAAFWVWPRQFEAGAASLSMNIRITLSMFT